MKKILVIRECCIGDILMSTPFLQELSRIFSSAQIDYMTGTWGEPVLEGNPAIHQKIPFLRLWGARGRTGGTTSSRFRMFQKIRKKKYDMAFVLDCGFQFILLTKLLGIPVRVGFDVEGRGHFLTHGVPRAWKQERHEVDLYLDLLRAVGEEPSCPPMKMYLTETEIGLAKKFWNERGNPQIEKELIAIAPGGGVNPGTRLLTKRWPGFSFLETARKILNRMDNKVHFFFIGGPGDRPLIHSIVDKLPRDAVTVSDGNPGLRQSAARLKSAKILLANDSGLMHLAAAIGIPTLSLFGPTNPKLLSPRGPEHRFLQKKTGCSPCYRQVIGDYVHCNHPACMTGIETDEVVSNVVEMIEN